MKLKHKEAIAGYIFALPSLAGFSLFFLFPAAISLYYSFTDGIGKSKFVGLKNFISLFKSESFLLAFKNTILFNLVSVPLIMLISLLLAMLLNNKAKSVPYFRMMFIVPMVIPVASVILVWNIIFNQFGVLNHFLTLFNIKPTDFLNTGWSFPILVMLFIWKNCGYNMIIFLAGLSNIPKDYYEAADIDGASSFTCFTKITLPLLTPTMFFITIMSMVNSFKVFREAYLLEGSYPDFSIYMLQHFMNNNFTNLSYQRLTTSAFVMAIIIFILVLGLSKVESKYGSS